MSGILRHQSRCILFSTTTGNIFIAFLASMVVAVHSARNFMYPVPMPKFMPGLKNVTTREGGVAVLPCSVRHLGTKKVAWRRIEEDRFLTIGKMTWVNSNQISLEYSKMRRNVSNWDLVIKHVTPKDAGIYECQVTSRTGRVRHVQLNVVGPPISKPDTSVMSRTSPSHILPDHAPNVPVNVCSKADEKGCLISITGKKYVDLGDKIQLKCNASSGVRVAEEMDWFKGGDKIDSDKYSQVIIEKNKSMKTRSFISILTIERSSLEDTGDYICRSSRNDIANLVVTVLHAESANKRRGTGSSYRSEEEINNGSQTVLPFHHVHVYLLCTCFVAIHWILDSSFAGLHS